MTSQSSNNDMVDKKSMDKEIIAVGVVKKIFKTEQRGLCCNAFCVAEWQTNWCIKARERLLQT